VLPWAHLSLIQAASRLVQPFFAQLTAECSCTLQRAAFHLSKFRLPMGGFGSHLIHDSLGPHPNIQPKQYLDPFSHFCTSRRVFLYFTMCRPFPLKLSLPMGDLDPHLIRAHPSPQLKWHLVRFSRFAELISLLRM